MKYVARVSILGMFLLSAYLLTPIAHVDAKNAKKITENFKDYSVGSTANGLNGGVGWTGPWIGDPAFYVQDVESYKDRKSLAVDGIASIHDANISRSFPAQTTGTVHWAQRKDRPDDGQSVGLYSGGLLAFYVGVGSTNQPQPGGPEWTGSEGNWWYVVDPYNVGTWGTVDAQFDTSTSQYRVSIDGGPYSSWKAFANPVPDIDTITLQLGGSGNDLDINYWDDIEIAK